MSTAYDQWLDPHADGSTYTCDTCSADLGSHAARHEACTTSLDEHADAPACTRCCTCDACLMQRLRARA
jgi:hypothetical protein